MWQFRSREWWLGRPNSMALPPFVTSRPSTHVSRNTCGLRTIDAMSRAVREVHVSALNDWVKTPCPVDTRRFPGTAGFHVQRLWVALIEDEKMPKAFSVPLTPQGK